MLSLLGWRNTPVTPLEKTKNQFLSKDRLLERYQEIRRISPHEAGKAGEISPTWSERSALGKIRQFKKQDSSEAGIAVRILHSAFALAELSGADYTTAEGRALIKSSLEKTESELEHSPPLQELYKTSKKQELVNSFIRTVENGTKIVTDDELTAIAKDFSDSEEDFSSLRRDLATALSNSPKYMKRVEARLQIIQKELYAYERPPEIIKAWNDRHTRICTSLLDLQAQKNELDARSEHFYKKLTERTKEFNKAIRSTGANRPPNEVLKKMEKELDRLTRGLEAVDNQRERLQIKIKDLDYQYQHAISYPGYIELLLEAQKPHENQIEELRSEFRAISRPFIHTEDPTLPKTAANLEKHCLPVILSLNDLPPSIPRNATLETLERAIEVGCVHLIISTIESLESLPGDAPGSSFYETFLQTVAENLQTKDYPNLYEKSSSEERLQLMNKLLYENLLTQGLKDPNNQKAITAISATAKAYLSDSSPKTV